MDPIRLPPRLCLFRLRLWLCDDVRVGADRQYRVAAVLAGVPFHAPPADAANRKRLSWEGAPLNWHPSADAVAGELDMFGEDDGMAQHRRAHRALTAALALLSTPIALMYLWLLLASVNRDSLSSFLPTGWTL